MEFGQGRAAEVREVTVGLEEGAVEVADEEGVGHGANLACYDGFMNPVLVSIVLALVVAGLLLLVLGRRRPSRPEAVVPPAPSSAPGPKQPCPLCGSTLGPGEKVHSVVFATVSDKLMEIAGCPHCRPPATLKRMCPVCKKELRPADVVTARVFERTREGGGAKTHVHVLGCPRCRS